MTEKSIIIIGTGLAGLSTGCYSQMNGYQTHIFEHHTMPGGVATCWKRKGYTIDGGIHFLMCHKPGQSMAKDLKALSPADSRFIDDLIAGARALRGTDMGDMGMSCKRIDQAMKRKRSGLLIKCCSVLRRDILASHSRYLFLK